MLSHTYSGRTVRRVAVGGREVGEFGLNAMVAHHLGVPVVLVTGDDALAGEAREAAPEAVAVATKRALGRYAAMCPPRRRVLEEIEEAAFQAARGGRGGARQGQAPGWAAGCRGRVHGSRDGRRRPPGPGVGESESDNPEVSGGGRARGIQGRQGVHVPRHRRGKVGRRRSSWGVGALPPL